MSWEQDLRRARDRNVADPTSSWPLDVLDAWWRRFPYGWEGVEHVILDVEGCIARGYGSCGDAAASILAACLVQGLDAWLCVEDPRVPTVPRNYAHVRVIVDGQWAFDPYSSKRPRGLPESCRREFYV